jgi:hypothetical protein
MMMLGGDKRKVTDSIISSIVGGKEEYSTQPKEMGESCKLCAVELIKAIEMKDPGRLIAAFQALMLELEGEDEKEGPELEIKF